MRAVVAGGLALVLALAGCLQESGSMEGACTEGEGHVFLRVTHSAGGPQPPDYEPDAYTLDRSGRLTRTSPDRGSTTVDAETFQDLCARVIDDFHTLDARYHDADCVDGDTRRVTASTTEGTHTVESYCGAGPPAFQDLWDAFQAAAADLP